MIFRRIGLGERSSVTWFALRELLGYEDAITVLPADPRRRPIPIRLADLVTTMRRERAEERGGANRPDDDSGADDPDSAGGTVDPAGWTPWSGGWELEWPPSGPRGDRSGRLLAATTLVGVALFFFPEPVTSVAGLALVIGGTVGLLLRLSRRAPG